ncbi:MAG: DsbA family protein [Solirubrobacterales bacterium]|nr:DsbA family protein [Solirubrobacterales bacterium]
MSSALTITEYTDPACPFAWSAEPSRRRLRWLYGDQLEWRPRMVGLSEHAGEYEERGFTPERLSASLARLAHAHGMPMDTSRRPRMAATVPACRAVVATRLHAPDREAAILRNLRVLHFSANLLDEPATLAVAAQRSQVDAAALEDWLAEPETERRLRRDLDEARHPTAESLALAHKLAGTDDGGHRYTCPSYEIVRTADGASLSVPGFQPTGAYEVAIANLGPQLSRRAAPDDVAEVLDWAGEPLASAEVAAVCEIDLDDARERLGRVAVEEHIGHDGLWSLN